MNSPIIPALVVALILLSASVAFLAVKIFFRREPALKSCGCGGDSSSKYTVDQNARDDKDGGCGCGGCGCGGH